MIVLPQSSAMNAIQCAAPCMNGGDAIMRAPPFCALARIASMSAHSSVVARS